MIIRRGGLKRYLPTQREGLDAQPGGILHLQEFFGGAVRIKENADGKVRRRFCINYRYTRAFCFAGSPSTTIHALK